MVLVAARAAHMVYSKDIWQLWAVEHMEAVGLHARMLYGDS